MATVEVARSAVEDLDELIATHSLPEGSRARVARSIRPLAQFPLLGAELSGRWRGMRFVLGPWRWMIVVYVYFEDDDRVVVLTIQDGRSRGAATRRPR